MTKVVSEETRPFISVILPTYRDWHDLQKCLNALAVQSYGDDSFEIVVINNDPMSLPPSDLQLPLNATLLTQPQKGSYAARNLALQQIKGEIVAFTDSDCTPDVHWLHKAVERLQAGAERIAGHVSLYYENESLSLAEIYEKAFAFNQRANAAKGESVTANMITWRRHFDKLGPFNDVLLSGGDLEWARRAQQYGIPIEYAPEVIVHHPARGNLNVILRKRRRVAGGFYLMNHHQPIKTFVALLVKGFFPPVFALVALLRKDEMSVREKLKAGWLAYYIKCYTSAYIMGLLLGMKKPER